MSEVVKYSLSCIEALINEKVDKDVLRSFRARARSIPSDMFMHGFIYTMTLLAARSSRSILEKGLKEIDCKNIVKEISSLKGVGSDERGYGLYGAMILYILKRLNALKSETFNDLIREASGNPVIEFKTRIVLEWLKRFSEAYIEE